MAGCRDKSRLDTDGLEERTVENGQVVTVAGAVAQCLPRKLQVVHGLAVLGELLVGCLWIDDVLIIIILSYY